MVASMQHDCYVIMRFGLIFSSKYSAFGKKINKGVSSNWFLISTKIQLCSLGMMSYSEEKQALASFIWLCEHGKPWSGHVNPQAMLFFDGEEILFQKD